jgi:hypothetical protein
MNWPITAFYMLIALTVCVGPAQAGEVYRWTDADGNVHITDKPPAEGVAVENTIPYSDRPETQTPSKPIPKSTRIHSPEVDRLNKQLKRLKERQSQLREIVAENEKNIAAAEKDAAYYSRRSGAYARRNQKTIQRQLVVLNNNLITYQSDLKYVEEDIMEVEARLKAIELNGRRPSGDQDLSPQLDSGSNDIPFRVD